MSGEEAIRGAVFQSYQDALDWMNGLIPFGIKPALKRMEQMMEMLGHPHRRLKFIHVAGTNGKGSTCAYLSRVLREGGYDVGTFTSPYIEKFTNRIQMNGEDIPEADVLEFANQIKPLVEQISRSELGSPTNFEVITTLAILYFAKKAYPDFVVWETGLGGRLDSTNIVVPILSVITNIGHDHMDKLGHSLAEIANEKAGIIKPGVPVVSAVEQPEALQVIEQVARTKQSTLYLLGREFRYDAVRRELDDQALDFYGPFRKVGQVPIRLNGEHQLKNAAVALMALEVLRQYYAVIVDDEQLLSAMAQTAWPGRLEMLRTEPRLLVDGAHNPEGAQTLAAALKQTYSYRNLHMAVAMLSTKNHLDYFRHILPLVDTLILTEPDFRNKMDAARLEAIVHELLPTIERENSRAMVIRVEPDWKKALNELINITEPEDLAVVTGTLYLISDIRSWVLYHSDSEKGW